LILNYHFELTEEKILQLEVL